MASKRSPVSRLLDNAGRRVRTLKHKFLDAVAKGDTLRQRMIEDQIENIEKFRKEIRNQNKKGKATTDYLYEKEMELKESAKLTTKDKEIEKNAVDRAANIESAGYGSIMRDPKYASLFQRLENLNEKYVGVYAELADREEAQRAMDEISLIRTQESDSLTDEDREMLKALYDNLERQLQEKGDWKSKKGVFEY